MVWLAPLVATVVLMLAAVTVAMVIGVAAAWAAWMLSQGNRLARIASIGLVAAMVLAAVTPLILHAAAWEATAGKFGLGILTQTGAQATSGDRYGIFAGFWATAWIHGLHGAAMVGLSMSLGTSRIPHTVDDQARLDIGQPLRWLIVQLPIASPWWTTALIATAGLVVTEMTVADLYGYRTVADQFYLYYCVEPTLVSILVTCSLPLAIALVVIALLLRWRKRAPAMDHYPATESLQDIDQTSEPASVELCCVGIVLAVLAAALMVGVPAYGLIDNLGRSVVSVGDDLVATWSWGKAWDRLLAAPGNFADEYQWTLILMGVTAAVSVAIAFPLASWERRRPTVGFWLVTFSILLVCVPGPMVGLMVVRVFQWEVPGFRMLYQQTIIPTVIALTVRALPIAYWIAKAGYRGVSDFTMDLARLDAGRIQAFCQVELPLTGKWIGLAFVTVAIVASGDLPVTLPVAPAGVSTVPTRLFGLLHSGARYQEAALALWYLIGLTIVVLCVVGPQVIQTGFRRDPATAPNQTAGEDQHADPLHRL